MIGDGVASTGALDLEGARQLARRIFEIYDRDQNGVLGAHEAVQMMVDTYKCINKRFSPSEHDVDTYLKLLDSDHDGQVTLSDVEEMVVRLMCSVERH